MWKRGIEFARTALFHASSCSLLNDAQKAHYDKKKAEGDHKTKAIVDVMRKNLRGIVSVLVDENPVNSVPKMSAKLDQLLLPVPTLP